MFGHTDILIRAGKIWSQVQFPLLFWQNANLAYTMQPETFSCLRSYGIRHGPICIVGSDLASQRTNT